MDAADCQSCAGRIPDLDSAPRPKEQWEYECLYGSECYPDQAYLCAFFTFWKDANVR